MNDELRNIEKKLSSSTQFNLTNQKELDKAISHIIKLLDDSYDLLKRDSYGSSVFLAITSIEETSKTHYSMYMKYDLNTKFSKDPLLNHVKKQKLSISPVFQIGSRLTNVIGNEKVEYLISLTNKNNELMKLRNNAIYWNTKVGENTFPQDCISKELANEMLLFAIEIFDDNLVGYTPYSITASKHTNFIFNNIKVDYLKKRS